MKSRAKVLVAICLFVMGGLVPSHAQNSTATAADQFDFLIGSWECIYTYVSVDGKEQQYKVRWNIEEILGGRSLQDTWEVMSLDGTLLATGTMFRSWDDKSAKWHFAEILSNTGRIHHMWGEQAGETMVMYEELSHPQYGDVIGRRVFSQIRVDSFHWQLDISRDGGNTWIEGIGSMNPKRVSQ